MNVSKKMKEEQINVIRVTKHKNSEIITFEEYEV